MRKQSDPANSWTKKDFKLEWFSGTGAGGQHRNKTQNCCRITHIESGLTATGQNSRSRVDNQREAFTALSRKLIALYYNSENARNHSDTIVRTYHFERNDVTDGVVHSTTDSAMDGKIDPFLENAVMGGRPLRQTGRA